MKDVIQPGAIKHSVVPKIMLQPASLSLRSTHTHSRDDPSGPRVTKVPEHPPGSHLEENDVSKQGHKEPRIDFKISLQAGILKALIIIKLYTLILVLRASPIYFLH